MLKNKLYKIWILAMAFALGACHDELLNPVPESVLTNVNAFNKASDLNLAVLGVYATYQDRIPFDYQLLEMPSDDMYAFYFGSAPGIEEITVLQVSPENPKINDFWKRTYNGIFRANSVLGNIEKPTDYAAGLKEQLIGEARFMRALYYFDLVRVFGGVPLITTVLTNEQARAIPRASEDEIYQLIIADLKDAITNLPLPAAIAKGRASKAAATALLAKVYVYRESWTEAKTTLEDLFTNYSYTLVGNYGDLFEIETENNSEAIFSIPYVSGTDGQGLTYDLAPIYGIYGVINNGNRVGRPTWDLHTKFEPGDSRFAVTISETQLTFDSKATDTPFWYPYFNKWVVPSPNAASSGLDIPVLRLGDMVLLYAEVLYNLNQPQAALDQINRIRTRSFGNTDHNYDLSDIPDADAFLDILLLERRLELVAENNRWFDLVRTGRYLTELTEYDGEYNPGNGTAVKIQVDVQPHMKYFPIPWEQIQLSGEGVLQQNDGYAQ
jgi:starch-binding outer membrane protein, SusD/RagB family